MERYVSRAGGMLEFCMVYYAGWIHMSCRRMVMAMKGDDDDDDEKISCSLSKTGHPFLDVQVSSRTVKQKPIGRVKSIRVICFPLSSFVIICASVSHRHRLVGKSSAEGRTETGKMNDSC